MGVFVNFSNHPSYRWSPVQIREAEVYGDIIDLMFPAVPPDSSEKEILNQAEASVEKILALNPSVVLCQGEFTLVFAVVNRLIQNGIRVVAACSERDVSEENTDDGIKKTVYFDFVRFRDYSI